MQALARGWVGTDEPRMGTAGLMDPRRGHVIIGAYELTFFNRYLRGAPGGAARWASPGIF